MCYDAFKCSSSECMRFESRLSFLSFSISLFECSTHTYLIWIFHIEPFFLSFLISLPPPHSHPIAGCWAGALFLPIIPFCSMCSSLTFFFFRSLCSHWMQCPLHGCAYASSWMAKVPIKSFHSPCESKFVRHGVANKVIPMCVRTSENESESVSAICYECPYCLLSIRRGVWDSGRCACLPASIIWTYSTHVVSLYITYFIIIIYQSCLVSIVNVMWCDANEC